MATKQIKRIGNDPIPFPFNAFAVTTVRVVHDIADTPLDAGDVLELIGLPPGAVLTDMRVETTGVAEVATVDVGLMTGTYADATSARTLGTELQSAGAKNTALTASLVAMDAIASDTAIRSVGVAFSAAVAAGTVILQASYKAV